VEPMVFLNIGWMNEYKGLDGGDTIQGGGAWVQEHGFGGEIFNFLPFQGQVYGYLQPHNDVIRLEQLGAGLGAAHIDGVLAVWVARSPRSGGTYVVGWYRNARLFRMRQNPPPGANRQHEGNPLGYFYVRAQEQDATLLDPCDRLLWIPRGKNGMGQSNVWFARGASARDLRRAVTDAVEQRANLNPAITAPPPPSPPRQPNLPLRLEVERRAMEETERHFRDDLHYTVRDVHKDNVGWDLEATRDERKRLLEVKGLSGNTICVELTPNEYAQMQANHADYRLCVVTNALEAAPVLSVFAHFTNTGHWEDENCRGRDLLITPIVGARAECPAAPVPQGSG
jgi:uncharacterized protein DUF3883